MELQRMQARNRKAAFEMDGVIFVLTLLAALGSGVVDGVFLAFSTFVMAGLDRLPPAQGIAAMQAINVAAITPLFMLALFGTGGICIGLVIMSLLRQRAPGAASLLVGGVVYLAGVIAVTLAFNMPRNYALAALTPDSAEGARL